MQRLNHHHLYLFWIFGKTESFTKTAKQLSIAQSAVTAQIKSLENSLDLKLIDRTNPRRVTVTNEGRQVLEYAESIFEVSRELVNWATKGALPKKQILRIGAISGLSRNLQYEFIKPFIARPDIKFEIMTADQKTLVELMNQHSLDVILTSHNVESDYGGKIQANVLTSTPIVFVTSKSTRLNSNDPIEKKMKGRDIYIPGKNFEAKPELDAYFEEEGFQVRIAGEIDDIALLRIIALRSGAVVAVPKMGVQNDILSGDLKVVGTAKAIRQKFYAIVRHKLSANPEIKVLIEKMRSHHD